MTYTDPSYSTHRYSYVDQYRDRPFAVTTAPPTHLQQQHPISVKVEDVDSSDLLPNQHNHSQYIHQPTSSFYRFGGSSNSGSISSPSPSTPVTPFTFMSQQSWPSSSSTSAPASSSNFHQQQQYAATSRMHGYSLHPPLDTHHTSSHHAITMNDDYDDGDDDGLADLTSGANYNGYTSGGLEGNGMTKAGEKQVRRRSSKACDQCRKSKCKCERNGSSEPCKNCVLLGTPCTFLGPSRKRGPPKGYIDAIEARLHQTEALIGILLASKDSRAKSLLEDLSEDILAKEIIERVNNSPYGHKGRKKGTPSANGRTRPASSENKDGEVAVLAVTHPTSEWQDSVTTSLNTRAQQRNTSIEDGESFGETKKNKEDAVSEDNTVRDSRKPSLSVQPPSATNSSFGTHTPVSAHAERIDNDNRRQRRRIDDQLGTNSPSSASGRSRSPPHYPYPPPHPALINKKSQASLRPDSRLSVSSHDHADIESDVDSQDGSGEDDIAIAIGQLSINEDAQVRYHGKASGLHLLGAQERQDGRSEGGIWRFPKARVWPPLPTTLQVRSKSDDEFASRLPSIEIQEHLIELYFTYVHAILPIIHKQSFLETFRTGNLHAAHSPGSEVSSPTGSQSSSGRPHRIPTLLLLAMFSIASRYSSGTAPPPEPGAMWPAGDSFMEDAKIILDGSYAQSRPSTCQALLLLGYREIGIGAMAQSWLYVGMAVRMAQDLGLHKSAEKWGNVGKNLFSSMELQERRRIWYGCVVMDKYVSSYIGRPVTIFENDFDTELPSVEESDELDTWVAHPSPVFLDDASEMAPLSSTPVTGYVISCFNESAKLSIILSMIMQAIYPIRPHSFRSTEFSRIEKLLDKWYIELPEHLRFDSSSAKYLTQPPQILTLHMQYWCTVILLHRPFIRHLTNSVGKDMSPKSKENEMRASSRKHYNFCVQAANHITSIVSIFMEHHCPRRAAVTLCYYVFTAAIMHVSTLKTYRGDPQARAGLEKCMGMLERMQRVWPSAWRANELLHGSGVLSEETSPSRVASADRHKRLAEEIDGGIRGGSPESRSASAAGTYKQHPSMYHQSLNMSSQSYPMDASVPSGSSPAFYQSYTRWGADNTIPNISSTLSTSVLPQQYSTGLAGERVQRNQDRRNGYPQYWSDYSSLGQMDNTYSVPVMGDMVSQHSSVPQNEQSMYVPDQYSMFNTLPPNNQ